MLSNISLKILIIEDSFQDKELIIEQLSDAGFQLEVTHAENLKAYTQALNNSRYDIILSDFKLPDFDAFGALEICQKKCPEVPFICVSGSIGEEKAIELLKAGAVDYVLKDRPGRLPYAIQRALEEVKDKEDRLKVEKELKESEERFRQVAESAQEWIWEVDRNGLYTYSSPMVEALLGYTPDEIVGKKYFYDFFLPKEKETLKAAAFEVFSKKEVFRYFENAVIHKSGKVVILSTSGRPICDENGNLKGYRGLDADITERKQAEIKLKDSEALMNTILNNVGAYIFLKDTSLRYLYVNSKVAELFNIDQQEIIGKMDSDFFPPESVMEIFKSDQPVITEGKTIMREEANIEIAAGKRTFWTVKLPLRDINGSIIGLVGISTDITERKMAEEERTLLYNTLSASLNEIFIFDAKSLKFKFVNSGGLRNLQYSSDELMEMTPLDIKPKMSEVEFQRLISPLRKGEKQLQVFETVHQRADGTMYPVEVHLQLFDKEQVFLAVIQDITERKQAEEKLMKSQERFRIAQEFSPDGFTILHPLRNHKGEIEDFIWVYENNTIARINGTEPNEVIGKRVLELFPAHAGTSVFEAYVQVADSGKTQILDDVYVGEITGNPIWLRLVVVSMGEDIAILAQDITARKLAEDAIRKLNAELEIRVHERTAQLEEVNKELEAFTYSVSHDLRTPLRAVNGFAEILYEDYGGLLPEEGKKICRYIRDNAQKMGNLINDLLKLSRLSRKGMLFSLIDMNYLVDAAFDEVTTFDQRNKILFNRDNLTNCYGDITLIKQVLINLLSNAVKYTSKTDNPVIEISSEIADGYIIYTVSDNGAGFDMKYVDKLFEVFQRLHSESEFEGTGVGLAIVNRIISRHGGKVWANGLLGKGAKFYFSLPINQ